MAICKREYYLIFPILCYILPLVHIILGLFYSFCPIESELSLVTILLGIFESVFITVYLYFLKKCDWSSIYECTNVTSESDGEVSNFLILLFRTYINISIQVVIYCGILGFPIISIIFNVMVYRNLYKVQYIDTNSIDYCDPRMFKGALGLNITTYFVIIIFLCLIYIFRK
jgi:hypothetical protein